MEKYFLVGSATTDPSQPEEQWYESYVRSNPCIHNPPSVAPDVPVDYLGEDLALNFVQGVVIDYARLDLLEILGPAAEEYLTLGKLLDRTGKVIPQYRTLGSFNPLWVRGNRKSANGFCSQCGELLYFALGKPYVLRQDLTGQPLYYGTQEGLIVNEALADRIREKHFKKIYVRELPVLERPRDGLPADLRHLTPASLPYVVDLVRLVGWQGRPVAEVRVLIEPLVKRYTPQLIDETTKELYEVDSDRDPPLVQLTEQGRKLALEILGPPR
jgi:hypothetical protein